MRQPVDSPCVGICRLNGERICVGCGRTVHEIADWPRLENTRRRAIRDKARARLRSLPPLPPDAP